MKRCFAACDQNCNHGQCTAQGKCNSHQCKVGYRYKESDETCERKLNFYIIFLCALKYENALILNFNQNAMQPVLPVQLPVTTLNV